MGYAEAATTVNPTNTTPTFQDRVRAALFAGCARIGSDTTITDPAKKSAFLGMMRSIIDNTDRYVTAFSWILAAEVGLTATSTDADIDTAINALWPAVSGYLVTNA